jgi:aspartate/methionine/tyrosine aminotransferase
LRAHGTIYLTLELTLEHFKDIKSDREFVKLLFEEENVSILPLSVFGTGLQGMRLMTCALEPYYDQFFARLEGFIERHKK